jgi:hypothetical protein
MLYNSRYKLINFPVEAVPSLATTQLLYRLPSYCKKRLRSPGRQKEYLSPDLMKGPCYFPYFKHQKQLFLTKLLQKKEAPRVDAEAHGEVTGKAGGTPTPDTIEEPCYFPYFNQKQLFPSYCKRMKLQG